MKHTMLVFGGATYLRDGDGRILWEYPVGTRDGWAIGRDRFLLALNRGGNYPGGAAAEVDKNGKILFEFKGTQDEVNTVQDVGRGRVMLTEAGKSPRLLEVEKKTGKVVFEMPIPAQTADTHLQTRMTRKLRNGNYLVPHATEMLVREYTPKGQIVWEVKTPGWAFTAIRLDNGNTVVGCTMAHTVVEFDRKGQIVWQVTNDDLPGRPLNDCCGVQRLPNGNTVITSYRAPANEVRLTEVTRDKQIVWQHRDPTKPGLHHFQILDTDGRPIKGRPLR